MHPFLPRPHVHPICINGRSIQGVGFALIAARAQHYRLYRNLSSYVVHMCSVNQNRSSKCMPSKPRHMTEITKNIFRIRSPVHKVTLVGMGILHRAPSLAPTIRYELTEKLRRRGKGCGDNWKRTCFLPEVNRSRLHLVTDAVK